MPEEAKTYAECDAIVQTPVIRLWDEIRRMYDARLANTGGRMSQETAALHQQELASGERFAFGKNWARFLQVLNEERIAQAEASLKRMLGVESLAGKSFLDIGSGSGLFSLAARRLGAKVKSFDYDPESVACTTELRHRFFRDDPNWSVEAASVLDRAYLDRLGQFDIVYSWGVLHHTGSMWQALANAGDLVRPGGRLWVALYNDQGGASGRWLRVKQTYNKLPRLLKPVFAFAVYLPLELRSLAIQLVRGTPQRYFRYIREYSKESSRGMSWWHDKIDWIGGLPFEVSKPDQVFSFYAERGFTLRKLNTMRGGLGCNEYVFERTA